MSFMDADYPNLELIEYRFKEILKKDEGWNMKMKEKRSEAERAGLPAPRPQFDAIAFPQVWGSTCTAFDVSPDGSPMMGGQAMTKEYTVVMEEKAAGTWCVFVAGEPCYMVNDPTDEFFSDLAARQMKALSGAKRAY